MEGHGQGNLPHHPQPRHPQAAHARPQYHRQNNIQREFLQGDGPYRERRQDLRDPVLRRGGGGGVCEGRQGQLFHEDEDGAQELHAQVQTHGTGQGSRDDAGGNRIALRVSSW